MQRKRLLPSALLYFYEKYILLVEFSYKVFWVQKKKCSFKEMQFSKIVTTVLLPVLFYPDFLEQY